MCLDISKSISTIDPESGNVLFSYFYKCISLSMISLIHNFALPNTDKVYKPRLNVSVIAQQSVSNISPIKILLQPTYVSFNNISAILADIHANLSHLEHEFSKLNNIHINIDNNSNFPDVKEPVYKRSSSDSRLSHTPVMSRSNKSHAPSTTISDSNVNDLKSMIQNCIFLLNSTITNSAPMIWLLTDGVATMNDVGNMDGIIMNCLRMDIPVSVFQLSSSSFHSNQTFGYVTDSGIIF